MSTRKQLLESVANVIKDFRAGEIDECTPEHVDRWVNQFHAETQNPLLAELSHVLDKTYFSKKNVSDFFAHQINHKKLTSGNTAEFWQQVNFLDIQKNGQSQQEILKLFGESLANQLGISIETCGSPGGPFFYLDDVLFNGGRIGTDLRAWIENESPGKAVVHILVIGTHRFGEWKCIEGLKEAAKDARKDIKFICWAAIRFENRRYYKNSAEVLWPAVIPDDELLAAYMRQEEKFPFEPRLVGGALENNIFSNEPGRQVLERELLLAGVKIRSGCQDPKRSMRPLGFSPFGLGFGSMIVTYRNCPNNCPLALWWGAPEATSGPFHWYPLLPRKTYTKVFDLSAFGF